MNIAVISDIRDNFHNLVLFFKKVKDYNPEKIIFLGDFGNNGIAKMLANSSIPVVAIWGNNDGEKVAITKTALSDRSSMTIGFDTYDFLEIDGRNIFITHYPMLAKPMAKSGDFDAVFYGHDHKKNKEEVNDRLILNPGEISAHKTGMASFAIYNTESNDAEIIDLDGSISMKTKEAQDYLDNMTFAFSQSKTHQL